MGAAFAGICGVCSDLTCWICSCCTVVLGSTGQIAHRRELVRHRKFIQMCGGRVAYYENEPALKVWSHQGNFYQGIGVVLHHVSVTEDRLAMGTVLRVGSLLNRLRLHECGFVLPPASTGWRFVKRAQRHARYRHNGIVHGTALLQDSRVLFNKLYKLGLTRFQYSAEVSRSEIPTFSTGGCVEPVFVREML